MTLSNASVSNASVSNASVSPQAIASFMRRSRRLAPLLLKTLDAAQVGVGIVDATYRVYYANPAMKEMNIALNEARVVLQGGEVPENPNRRLASLVERALHQKKTDGLIHVAANPAADGTPGEAWEVELFPLNDEEGHAFCAMVVQSVSHRAQPQAQPQAVPAEAPDPATQALTQTPAAEDGKHRAIALLAHELRSPLSAAGMALQLLNIDPKLRPFRAADPDVDESFKAFDRSLAAMRRLVDDLMDFNRLTLGKLSIERKTISLEDVVREAANDCSQEVQDAQHRLSITPTPTPTTGDTRVNADYGRIKQVVCNLLRNSVRYTDEGGQIQAVVSRQGAEVELKVIDNGRGIPSDRLERLFEPFEQVDPHEGGLGLGLGLCRQIVAAHDGTITAQSEGLGKGSTFTVRLPAAEP